MTLEEILLSGGGGLAILLTLIQISPLKINPWSALKKGVKWLWRAFTRSLNADVLAKLEELETGQRDTRDKLEELETGQRDTRDKLEEHIQLADKREADSYRASILHFNVKLIQRVPHTREDFIEILSDIDHYEDYCDTHRNYENNRAICAIANIKRVYADRMAKGDFA